MNDETQPSAGHRPAPKISFDGGDMNCGNGLLLMIRRHIDPLAPGELLEIISTDTSVRDDLPAWCRLTKNQLVSQVDEPGRSRFLVSKGAFPPPIERPTAAPIELAPIAHSSSPPVRTPAPITEPIVDVYIPDRLPAPVAVPEIAPLAVMGIGSWPRPKWLLQALHAMLERRLSESDFQEIADDAVRLCVEAQRRAGVDVLTDGEQRRDDYASFVGGRLDNCQLIPITDLLPYVDHPDEFAGALAKLDVPAEKIRHPAVFGPLGRRQPLAVHELHFAKSLAHMPVKVALPGPYLLMRTMWMECISDRAYARREDLAQDIVRVLREEIHALLAAGAALVQLDEPVLTEVVYGRPETGNRSFMCGALGSKGPVPDELALAAELVNQVVADLPAERLALHICRGNWTTDEQAALRGDYRPLLQYLSSIHVGTLFLECCTPRAGELSALAALPDRLRIGVGVVDQKQRRAEAVDEIVARGEQAIQLFGAQRVLLNPDCGFATFADNPITSAQLAEAKLTAVSQAATILRSRHLGA